MLAGRATPEIDAGEAQHHRLDRFRLGRLRIGLTE